MIKIKGQQRKLVFQQLEQIQDKSEIIEFQCNAVFKQIGKTLNLSLTRRNLYNRRIPHKTAGDPIRLAMHLRTAVRKDSAEQDLPVQSQEYTDG